MKKDENLLWRDFISGGPHVDLLVDIDAGDNEENPCSENYDWHDRDY